MALCPLWFWLLNSLIVRLMEEEIRFFFFFLVLFNTAVPLAPALVVGQWAVWLEAGRCRVTRRGEQWGQVPESALSCCFALPATHPFLFPPTKLANQSQLCAVEGDYAHFMNTHTQTHTFQGKKSVGVGWIVRQKKKKQSRERCQQWTWNGQILNCNF